MARRKRENPGCSIDMTPMIDVVFQLIIFFIVCMSITKQVNEDILLADGKHGEIIKDLNEPFEIEVDKDGLITVKNIRVSSEKLRNTLASRVKRMGGASFPVLIRGDVRATHEDIKHVMDICTVAGLWQLSFVVVEKRAPPSPTSPRR